MREQLREVEGNGHQAENSETGSETAVGPLQKGTMLDIK